MEVVNLTWLLLCLFVVPVISYLYPYVNPTENFGWIPLPLVGRPPRNGISQYGHYYSAQDSTDPRRWNGNSQFGYYYSSQHSPEPSSLRLNPFQSGGYEYRSSDAAQHSSKSFAPGLCRQHPEYDVCMQYAIFCILNPQDENCRNLFGPPVQSNKTPVQSNKKGKSPCAISLNHYACGSDTSQFRMAYYLGSLNLNDLCTTAPEDPICPKILEDICTYDSESCEKYARIVCPKHPNSIECIKLPTNPQYRAVSYLSDLKDRCFEAPENIICPRVVEDICNIKADRSCEYARIVCPKHPKSTECAKYAKSFFHDHLGFIDVCYNAPQRWFCSFELKNVCELDSNRCERYARASCPKHSVSECLNLHGIRNVLGKPVLPDKPTLHEIPTDPRFRAGVVPKPNEKPRVYDPKNLTDLCSKTPENRVCPRVLTNICTFDSETCQKYIPIVCPKHPKSFGCLKLLVKPNEEPSTNNPLHMDYMCTEMPTLPFCPKILKKFCEPDDETCEELIVNVCSKNSESEECVKYFPKWREIIEFPIDDIIKGLAE